MPADTSGTGCLSRGHPGLTLPSRHYRNILKSAPALRRRGHDRLGRYAGYAEAVLFFDDQQAEAGQLPLEVEQPSLVPVFQRSALPRFHRPDSLSAVPLPVYFATMSLLDRRACPMVADSGGPGWKQPSFQPVAGNSPICSSGGGWKTQLKTRW